MVTITNAALRATTYETIYDRLNGNIGSYNSSSQPTVTASYIDKAKNLPQIVIYPVDVDEDDFAFKQSFGTKEVRVLIEVYTKQKKDIDLLTDDIDALMDTIIAGLSIVSRSESTAFEMPNQNKLHAKAITFVYLRK